MKITAIGVLYEEVLSQIPKCFREIKKTEEAGIGETLQCLILAIKYAAFLNSIYALCENLSNVVYQLYRNKVPLGFREQKERFVKNRDIDSTYSTILEQTDWYAEVNSMRAEATHFLSGLITISSATELGYVNIPKSKRKGAPQEVQIHDVERHVRKLYYNVITFLSRYGDQFVKIINQDVPVSQICYIIPRVGMGCKKISLKGLQNKESGICQKPNFECPEKDSCKARRTDMK